MKTVQEIIRRLDSAKTQRSRIEQYWKSAYDATYPLRGQLIGADMLSAVDTIGSARNQNTKIYDATLKDACSLLASALLSGLTPAHSRWFSHKMLGTKEVPKDSENWLDNSANVLWEAIHDSNYDIVGYETMLDYVVSGMPVMYIEEDNFQETGRLFNFRLWPLGQCYFADSTGKGIIDTVLRVLSFTGEQAISEYGEENVSESLRKKATTNPDELHQFVHAIFPRGKNKKRKELPIASVHIEMKSKKKVRDSGYWEMPVVVPRWLPIPGSVYSLGPCDDALPDHNTLNEVVKLVLANADMAVAGMWLAVDDGVLNPKTVKVGARKIIIAASKDSLTSLKSSAQFDVAALEIDRLQNQIRRLMKADQLQITEGPQMTAEEVRWRQQLNRQVLAPMFGRLLPEYASPVVERCFGIAYRAGVLGDAPESIQNRVSKITYKSPIARSQKLEDVAAMDRFEMQLATLSKNGITGPLDNYDIDEASRERAELLGVPTKLIRDKKAVEQIRKDRAAEIKAQQQAQQKMEMQKSVMPAAMKGAMDNAE